MESRMRSLADENEQLKRQLQIYQNNTDDGPGGDIRLKRHIQLLQDEVQYLTKINEQQDEQLRLQSKQQAKRNKSKSQTRSRRKSQMQADHERSTSRPHRDCCVKKRQAIENETMDQLSRIAEQRRQHSPMSVTPRHNQHASTSHIRHAWHDHQQQSTLRSTYSKASFTGSCTGHSNLRDKSRSRTPNKRKDSRSNVTPRLTNQHNKSQSYFEPLPNPHASLH